jgi:hypothetical protein
MYDLFGVIEKPRDARKGFMMIGCKSIVVLEPRQDCWWSVEKIDRDDEEYRHITYRIRCVQADCIAYILVPYQWSYEGRDRLGGG